MLPEGFAWLPRWQYDRGDNAVFLDGVCVCFLDTTADGQTWWVRLWAHRGMGHPLITRTCTSYEAGRAGCEAWVCRHESLLRQEVAAHRSRLPSRRWASRPDRDGLDTGRG